MRRTWIGLAFALGLVAACGGSAATGTLQANGTPAGGTQSATTQPSTGATGATGTPTGGAPKTLDACSLITAGEASAALGGEPVDPGTVPEPGARSCLFSGHPAQGFDLNAVEISLIGVDTFNPTQKSITGLTITQISGIGDAAYTVSLGAGHVVLNVRKGQTTFSTSVLLKSASDSDLLAAEKTLALLILGRI